MKSGWAASIGLPGAGKMWMFEHSVRDKVRVRFSIRVKVRMWV